MLASQVKTGLNWASLAKFLDSVPETTLISKIQQRVTVVQFSIKIKVEVSSEAISNHQSNTFPLSYLTSPSLHSPTPSPLPQPLGRSKTAGYAQPVLISLMEDI